MKINREKQKGLTAISWMVVIALVIVIFSAGVKVAPHYLEFNNVRSMMDSIAAEPGIKNQSNRYITSQVSKYMNINSMYELEKIMRKKSPFKVVRSKKTAEKTLSVEYETKVKWMANLSFLMDFKHDAVLGKVK